MASDHSDFDPRGAANRLRAGEFISPARATGNTAVQDRTYAYPVSVTNLMLSPRRLYLFHSLRATTEKNVRH